MYRNVIPTPQKNMLCIHYKNKPVNAVQGKLLFIVGTIRNTQMHYVGIMKSFNTLKQMIRRATVGLQHNQNNFSWMG
jgi:hypothetical protein